MRRAIEQMKIAHAGEAAAKVLDHAHKLLFEKKDARAGIVQNVSKLIGREADVQWKKDSPRFKNTVICFEQTVAICAEKCHAVARLHACRPQSTSEPADAVGELRIGEAMVIAHNGKLFRVLLRSVSKKADGCEGDVH